MEKQSAVWLFVGLLFAGITEGIQYFLSYRSFNINDLLANALGVIFGACILIFMQVKKQNTKSTPNMDGR